MEPLKEKFNLPFFRFLGEQIKEVHAPFNQKTFLKLVSDGLEDRELKERMRHTTETLHQLLPADYPSAIAILNQVAPTVKDGLQGMLFPDFVGRFGLMHFDLSMQALHHQTQFSTGEFAIREFLRDDFARTHKTALKWAGDKNHHVRRLASEGTRPRLPWSFKLNPLIQDPGPSKILLEKLLQDDSLYVRKSVANHLNDLSKDHPETVLEWCQSWDRSHPHTRWIVRHGLRSLIKAGNPKALELRGFDPSVKLEAKQFLVEPERISLGNPVHFRGEIELKQSQPAELAIDYAIHYVKANGQTSRKVFKWKEVSAEPGKKIILKKKQQIKNFTTRKHYSGYHKVELIVNGKRVGETGFELGC